MLVRAWPRSLRAATSFDRTVNDQPLLKDIFFSDAFLQRLAADLRASAVGFDAGTFLACARGGGFAQMALKEKMRHITHCLHAALPGDYTQNLACLLQLAPRYTDLDGMLFSDYVACYGLDDWQQSLPALRQLTRAVSAEFAIRPFLARDPQRVLPLLYEWARDPDPAVRRLASEGSRPRLPWAMALTAFKKDPRPLLPILEALRDDPSEDVRRSVANNLNDIAKDHPRIVLEVAERWYGESEEVDRLVKHACRTLLKAGNPRAMRLFGFADPHFAEVRALAVNPAQPVLGHEFHIDYVLALEAAEPSLLRLEYAVTFARPKGKRSRKVFHHREGQFAPGSHPIRKKHSLRDLSTRKHYAGPHRVEIIVNGETKGELGFEVLPWRAPAG